MTASSGISIKKITWAGFTLLLFSFFLAAFSYTKPGSSVDSSLMSLVESLLQRRTFKIDGTMYFNPYDMAYFHGHYYSGKQPLLSLYTAVILFPLHLFGSFTSPAWRAFFYYAASVTSSGAAAIAIFFILQRLFRLTGAEEKGSRWVTAYIFFGSILLPLAMTYNTHIVEAALLLGTLSFLIEYRLNGNGKAPAFCGLLTGLSAALHIFAGTIFAGLTAVYFLTSRPKHFFRFLIFFGFILTIGVCLNQIEHGDPRPFYMMPETFLFPSSPNLRRPTLSNLSEKTLAHRLDELDIPMDQKVGTMIAYKKYHREVGNVFSFAWISFLSRDFLCFTPIFFAGIFSLVGCIFKKKFRFWREALWVLAGTLISYLGLLYTRSNPGFSFGNRYLVPQIVLVLFFTQFYFENAENLAFFRLFFWTAFAMMAPGLMAPLRIPNPLFLQANLVLSLSVLALHAVTVLIPALRTAPEKLLGFFSRRPWAAVLLMAVLLRIEMSIYVGTAVF